jgi:hypothetical protein
MTAYQSEFISPKSKLDLESECHTGWTRRELDLLEAPGIIHLDRMAILDVSSSSED